MSGIHLSTGSLRLRPWQLGDAPAVFAACQDLEIQRWTTLPSPYTRADADHYVGVVAPKHWTTGSGTPFAVLDSRSGRIVASVGLGRIVDGVGEIGYWCAAEARGRGVVSGAVSAVCRWAFAELGLRRLEWRAEVGNEPSRRVAEKTGFRYEGIARNGLLHGGRPVDGWVAGLLPGEGPAPPDVLAAGDLLLRPWRRGDLPALARMSDESARRWGGLPEPGQQSAQARVLEGWIAARWLGHSRQYAVEAAGNVVGSAMLYPAEPRDGTLVAGYTIAPADRGRGLATRVLGLLTAEAARRGAIRVEAGAEAANTISLRVIERAGYVREGVLRDLIVAAGERRDVVVSALVRRDPAWPA